MATVSLMCSSTTGPIEPKRNVRIWLEVGYACEPRRTGRSATQQWRVWLRGVAGADLAPCVRRVVFQLRPENKFPYPERVFEEPPYLVQQCGFVPTEVQITVFLKHTTQPEKIHLKYGPLLLNSEQCKTDSRCVFYDVKYATEELQAAVISSYTTAKKSDVTLVVLPDSEEAPINRPIRPLQHKRVSILKHSAIRGISKKKVTFSIKKCDSVKQKSGKRADHHNVSSPDCAKKLKLPPPLLDENRHRHISKMCSALSLYQRSVKALQLPPLRDPLFQLPVLPESLRRMLPKGQPDHVLT